MKKYLDVIHFSKTYEKQYFSLETNIVKSEAGPTP